MTELPIVVNMTVDASPTEYDLKAETNQQALSLSNDIVIDTSGQALPLYEGPYTVDAGLNAVTLDTDGKRMVQDVTVNALQENDITGNSLTINTSTGKVSSLVSISRGYSPSVFGVANSLQLSTQARATITPTASEQTAVARNKYTLGAVKVRAISSPYADVSGVTATAGDVLSGKYFVDSSGVLTLGTGGGGMDAETKDALLECFEHVAWADSDGQIYYNNLLNALYPLQSISAVYTQSGTVTPSTPLDDLKSDLVVTATFEDGTTKTVTNYTLSGTLAVGTSTVTVTYFTETTTFNVTVSISYKYIWKLTDNDFSIQPGSSSWDATHGIFTSTNQNSLRKRRNIYISTGVKPMTTTVDDITWTVTNPPQYPIPVPGDAVRVTCTITPATMQIGGATFTYNSQAENYNRVTLYDWSRSSFTYNIQNVEYFVLFARYNSSNSTFSSEPTEITITFNT